MPLEYIAIADANGVERRVAVDSDGGSPPKYAEVMKLAVSDDGDLTLVPGSATYGLKVDVARITGTVTVDASGADVPVTVASLPLPSGAAKDSTLTDGTQRVGGTVAVSGPLTDTELRAAAVPVSGTFYQATQPVSVASLPLPSGAAQEHATAGSPHAARLTDGSAFYKATTPSDTQPVSGTFWQATQPVSGTVTANAGTGTLAVSVASLPLPAGAATAAKQPALGVAGTASADVITVQGRSGMTAVVVDGSGVTQPVSGTFWQATQPVSAASLPLPTGAALDSTLTDGSLIVGGTVAVTGGLTDTELRAAAVPVSGPLTDAELRAAAVETKGGIAHEESASVSADGVLFTVDASEYRWVSVHITQLDSGTAIFEASNDNSGWFEVMLATSSFGDSYSEWPAPNGPILFHGPLPGRYFRLRADGMTTGTVAAVAEFYYSPEGRATSYLDMLAVSGSLPVSGTLGVSAAQLPPTTGVWPMTQSLSVTMASDQTAIPVSGPLTDTQLRASAVPISGTVTVQDGGNVISVDDAAGSLTIDSPQLPSALAANGGLKIEGVAGGVVVPISVASLPLPATAAKDSTLTDGTQRVGGTVTVAGAVTNAGTFAVQDSQKIADNAGFTDGTTPVGPAGYILDETAGTALTENDIGAARMDSKRAQVLVIEDATTRGRRAVVTAGGLLSVDASGVAVPVTDNSGSLTVDAPVGTPVFARLSDGSAALVGQKLMAASLPVVLASDHSTITVAGAVTNAGTFAVQDSQVIADNAGFTDGTSKLFMGGFIYDETAGTALSENDAAAARVNANRSQIATLEDPTTRGRYATVTAANALKVDPSAVTQPTSHAPTKARTSIWSAQTLTAAAADTTATAVDLTAVNGATLNIKLTNGATGPTIAAQVQIQCSADNSNWYNFGGPLVGLTTNAGVQSWVVDLPAPEMYVRLVAGSNTGQNVTVDADIAKVTG